MDRCGDWEYWWGIIELMSQLEKRRAKFIVEIKRERKEEYFRATREKLLRMDSSHPASQEEEQPRLGYLVRVSLAPNAILPLLRQQPLLQELTAAADTRNPEKSLRVIVICGNALLDDLHLQEKQALSCLLIRLLKDHGLMGGSASGAISAAMLSLAQTLPYIQEGMAGEGEEVICNLTLELLQWAIPQAPSQSLTDTIKRALGAIARLVFECEYDIQVEGHFSRNLLFYNGLLQLHPKLMQERKEHCLFVRGVMLKFFENISLALTLNHFPLVFQGQAFASFLMEEIVNGIDEERQSHAQSTLINLLVDYQPVDCTTLMGALTRPHARAEAFFIRLLHNGNLVGWRVKILKILISRDKFYHHCQAFFDEFWKGVADLCVEVLRDDRPEETVHFAVQILMVLHEMRRDEEFKWHLLNQGAEPLFEHLLDREWEEAELMEKDLRYLLDHVRWE